MSFWNNFIWLWILKNIPAIRSKQSYVLNGKLFHSIYATEWFWKAAREWWPDCTRIHNFFHIFRPEPFLDAFMMYHQAHKVMKCTVHALSDPILLRGIWHSEMLFDAIFSQALPDIVWQILATFYNSKARWHWSHQYMSQNFDCNTQEHEAFSANILCGSQQSTCSV